MIQLTAIRGRSSCNSCGDEVTLKDITIGRNQNSGSTQTLCLRCRIELKMVLEADVIEHVLSGLEAVDSEEAVVTEGAPRVGIG
jgi:hypothetical protein